MIYHIKAFVKKRNNVDIDVFNDINKKIIIVIKQDFGKNIYL